MKIKNKLVPILTAVVLSAGLMPVTAFADEPAGLPNQTIGENETNNQNSDGDAQQALVTITEQPQDASVNYPEGVTFQVAVDEPENVASWQWILEDTAGKTYELAGETATTDTLVLLSTSKTAAVEHYYCVITDTDGNTVTSEKAGLSIANQEESKPVLYVAEYAIEPGETLDVADTELSGSGTVSFSEDGKEIIFNDFKVTNDWHSADLLCGAIGVELLYLGAPSENYKVTLNGENVIHNANYDEKRGSGSAFELAITPQDGVTPSACSIEGPGSLTLQGAGYGMLSYADLVFNTSSVETVPEHTYMYGFVTLAGADVTVSSGVTLNLEVLGCGLYADGDLNLESGSKTTINSKAPYYPGGEETTSHGKLGPDVFSASECLFVGGTMTMKNAELVVNGMGDESLFPEGENIASFAGISGGGMAVISAEDSTITINMDVSQADHQGFANTFGAMSTGTDGTIKLKSTDLRINVKSTDIYDGSGIVIPGDFYVTDGSNVTIEVKANGRVRGITAYTMHKDGDFVIHDSNVIVDTESLNGRTDMTYGIRAGRNCSISLSEGYNVHSIAKGGMAFGALTGEGGSSKGYQPGYQASHITLGEHTGIILPEDYEINIASVPGPFDPYDYCEAVYDFGKTDKPTDDVAFSYVELPFNDVPVKPGYWVYDSVKYVYDHEIMTGMRAGYFGVSETLSRAQFATILYRIAGNPAVESKQIFPDVPITEDTEWYADAVEWANENKIILGYLNGNFGPADSITREQLACMLYRYAECMKYDLSKKADISKYPDAKQVSDWAVEAMKWAVGNGIITGEGGVYLNPIGVSERAECAAMVERFMTKFVEA